MEGIEREEIRMWIGRGEREEVKMGNGRGRRHRREGR